MSDNRRIRKVAQMMDELKLMEITSEASVFWGMIKDKLHVSKQQICCPAGMPHGFAGAAASKAGAHAANPHEAADVSGAITSPMVGIVYLAPEPNAKPFAQAGQKVNAGDTLCLIEAMKTFNPIKAHKAGVVADILVKDGDTVEYGTPLVVVK